MRRCDYGGDVAEIHDGGLERRLPRVLLHAQDQAVLAYRGETAYLAVECEVKLNVNPFTKSGTHIFRIQLSTSELG